MADTVMLTMEVGDDNRSDLYLLSFNCVSHEDFSSVNVMSNHILEETLSEDESGMEYFLHPLYKDGWYEEEIRVTKNTLKRLTVTLKGVAQITDLSLEPYTTDPVNMSPGQINQIVNVTEEKVIVAETAMILNAWIRNLLVEFVETNFDAIDPRKPYPESGKREFVQIYGQNIRLMVSLVDPVEIVPYETPDGDQVYWTAVDDNVQAYKFFTITDPVLITPDADGLSETGKETLRERFRVKVRKQTEALPRFELTFDNTHEFNIPKMYWGTGDENGLGRGFVYKDGEGMFLTYTSRTNGSDYGLKLNDSGVYYTRASDGQWVSLEQGSGGNMTYAFNHEPTAQEVSNLPDGAVVLIYDPGATYTPPELRG
ncbi:MAG: hypothetical protein LBU94_03165 [Clostridiales bacterium]|jgi:hypothetical protein|nr:hypothetical protein [Clostridiales bacterium]